MSKVQPKFEKSNKEAAFETATDAMGIVAEEASGVGIAKRAWGHFRDWTARDYISRIVALESDREDMVKTLKSNAAIQDAVLALLREKDAKLSTQNARIVELEKELELRN